MWGGGLTLSGNFHSWSRRPVWNVLTEDEDKQDLEGLGSDQDVQVLGGIILPPKYVVSVFKSCIRIPVDEQKRFENANVWTEIFLKTEKNICLFKRKRTRVNRVQVCKPCLHITNFRLIQSRWRVQFNHKDGGHVSDNTGGHGEWAICARVCVYLACGSFSSALISLMLASWLKGDTR